MMISQNMIHVSISGSAHDVIGEILGSLIKPDKRIIYIDGVGIADKKTFLEKIAEALHFPDYFGANWDALEEGLTDVSDTPAAETILIYDRPDVFANASPTDAQKAIDILSLAVESRKNTSWPLTVVCIRIE